MPWLSFAQGHQSFFGEVLGLMFPEHANEVLKDKDSLQVKFSGLNMMVFIIILFQYF